MIDQRKYNVLFILATLTTFIALYNGLGALAGQVKAQNVIISPLPTSTIITIEEPIYIVPSTIEDKIRAKFGEHADTALLLLRGKDGGCSENGGLDPKAINDNVDGSQDFGVFQLNSHWNGFNKYVRNTQLLLDSDINIGIAYRLFVQNGYSFGVWACGKAYGI